MRHHRNKRGKNRSIRWGRSACDIPEVRCPSCGGIVTCTEGDGFIRYNCMECPKEWTVAAQTAKKTDNGFPAI